MEKKKPDKWRAQLIFLSIVILLYAVTWSTNPVTFKSALKTFTNLVIKVLPALAIVLVFLFTANLFLDSKSMAKILAESSGLKAWAAAILAGLISTGPIYLWYPLLAKLRDKGVRDSLLVVFLYNRAVKIPLIPLLAHYFGLTYTLVLTAYMILFSVINGFIVDKITAEGLR
jgi:uncharacterized membrane protein YraQ (UPF0718 family)